MDGETVDSVRYVTIRRDRNGNHCLMILTDPTLAAHLAGVVWPEPLHRNDTDRWLEKKGGGRMRGYDDVYM